MAYKMPLGGGIHRISSARLQYRHVYDYPTQIERLWSLVPKEQTLVLLFDDLEADTAGFYRRIQSFLGLLPHDLAAFEKVNENKQLRSRFLVRYSAPRWRPRRQADGQSPLEEGSEPSGRSQKRLVDGSMAALTSFNTF